MKIPLKIQKIIRHPYTKPILILTLVIALLLAAVPFFITRTFNHDDANDGSTPDASFETVKVPETIAVYRTGSDETETVDFEEYVKGVVSCEMPSSFHTEALKAQAVAARTYSVSKVLDSDINGNPSQHPQAPLCDTIHCQVYKNKAELRHIKGNSWIKDDWNKICSAVDDTEGQLLYYNGKLVQQALFHSSSGGMTENSEDVFASAVPYLVSVESPYEEGATHQNEKTALSMSEFTSAVTSYYPSIEFGTITPDSIKILSRSSGDRVEKMQVGSGVLTGRQVREALGLASANFTIAVDGNTITFTTNGSGHGVGMSQYGANGMAKEGYGYKKILSHYYSGTEIY